MSQLGAEVDSRGRADVGVGDSERHTSAAQGAAHPHVGSRKVVILVGPVADANRKHLVRIRVIQGHLEFGDVSEQSVGHGISLR